jgi:hypothetical protein
VREVSLAEVADQIRQEGAAYGLVPVIQGAKCFVAQTQMQVSDDGGVIGQIYEETVPICSVSMDAPLGNVWKSRKERYEFDLAAVYIEARLRREAAQRRAADERADERRRELERLGRRFGFDTVVMGQIAAVRRGVRRQQGR